MFPPEFVAVGQCPVHEVDAGQGATLSAADSPSAQQLIDSLRTGDCALIAVFHAHGIKGGAV
jgi:hypothetical protein